MNTSGSGLLWTLTGLPAATMGVMVILMAFGYWWPGGCLAARFLSITQRLIKRHYRHAESPSQVTWLETPEAPFLARSPSQVTWLETPEAPFLARSQSPGIMMYGERNWPINLYQNDRSPRRPSNVAARILPQQIYHKFVPWQIYYKFVPQFSGLLI